MTTVQMVPDNTSYNAILDSTAISSSQLGGHIFRLRGHRFDVPSYIDLHGLSEGAARLALRWWLSTAVADQLSLSQSWQGIIVTGYGKSRYFWHQSDPWICWFSFVFFCSINICQVKNSG
jgi:DNA-nicking Smr family endonuclease